MACPRRVAQLPGQQDVGGSDSCRISASITHADSVERRPPVRLPDPSALELEQAVPPRDPYPRSAS
ncbi:hypothetical protein ACFXJM_35855 [Streptomyces massasporeus]